MSDLIRREDIPYIDLNIDMPQSKVRVWVAFNEQIDALPSAEPKTGKWVEVEINEYEGFNIVNMRCNQCRKYAYLVLPKGTKCVYDFCPNCGAMMLGEDSDTE